MDLVRIFPSNPEPWYHMQYGQCPNTIVDPVMMDVDFTLHQIPGAPFTNMD